MFRKDRNWVSVNMNLVLKGPNRGQGLHSERWAIARDTDLRLDQLLMLVTTKILGFYVSVMPEDQVSDEDIAAQTLRFAQEMQERVHKRLEVISAAAKDLDHE